MSQAKLHRTTLATVKQAQESRQWILVDAQGKTLGRLASELAKILRGKHKVNYTPNVDMGDGIVVVNAKDVKVTGNKEAQMTYRHYTGYPGGEREIPYRRMMERHPERILEAAVRRMMPRNRLSRTQLTRLRIFAGQEHNLQAQKPVKVEM